MITYKISIDFDYDEAEFNYDAPVMVDIEDFYDNDFGQVLADSKGISEFEEWYNDGIEDSKDFIKISKYDMYIDEDGAEIYITLDKPIEDSETFAKEVLEYLYDESCPQVNVHFSGYDYEMAWDGLRSEPYERRVNLDSTEMYDLKEYTNLRVEVYNQN